MFLNNHDDDDEMPGSGQTPRRMDYEPTWRPSVSVPTQELIERLKTSLARLETAIAPFKRAGAMLTTPEEDGDQPLVVVPPGRTAEGASLYVRDFQALSKVP